MEVLEETELSIIKSQQKEYEEIVNAELIIAQRFEAAEQRCKEEISRRNIQNKARKDERRAAHQKLNARGITKNYLSGLRERAFGELTSMGILVQPNKRVMEEEVMPWLMGKIIGFLNEDKSIEEGSLSVVDDGIDDAQKLHAATLKAKYDAIEQKKLDEIEAKKQKEIRKENRRLARIKREKDLELEKFRDLIEKNVVYKGEVQNVLSTNLVDITGNYESENSYISAIGGQVLQLFYSLEEISTKYPQGLKNYMEKKIQNDDQDYFLRPNNPSELLLPEHLMPFLMHYIKDMKNESIDILLHPHCVQFLEEQGCELDDISVMDDEQLIAFKEIHGKNIMSKSHKNRGKIMDRLYDYLIDIMAKKVPTDNVTVKIDQIHHKVKFVTMPDDVVEEDYEQKIISTEEPKEGEEVKDP